MNRVFACNGSVQLVASVAAGRTIARDRRFGDRPGASNEPAEDRDVIVLHDLAAPPEQANQFAGTIEAMAMHLGRFDRVVYLQPLDIDDLEAMRRSRGFQAAADALCLRLDLETVDEIYLVQNLGSCRRLLLRAFPGARKICCGDGIGINFSSEYFSPTRARWKLWPVRRSVRRMRDTLRELITRDNAEHFTTHALLLPNLFDEQLDRFVSIDAELFRCLFDDLGTLLDADDQRERAAAIAAIVHGAPEVVCLLSTNFSESAKMDVDAELAAYMDAVRNLRPAGGSVLVLKPHPRDSPSKIARLRDLISPLFRETIVLDDPLGFHLPFEVVLARLLASRDGLVTRVLCFSTACLSIEWLYAVRCTVGFGEVAVRQWFRPQWVNPRLRHERDLGRALEVLRTRDR